MEFDPKWGSRKDDEKYPVWMVVVLAISIVIIALVWVPHWIGSKISHQPDRLPSLSPTNTKIILVDETKNHKTLQLEL